MAMNISNVTHDDGRRCAALIQFLRTGKWDMSGQDAEELVRVKQWVHALAMEMANQIKSADSSKKATAPVESMTMKIKAMGSLPGKGPVHKAKAKTKK